MSGDNTLKYGLLYSIRFDALLIMMAIPTNAAVQLLNLTFAVNSEENVYGSGLTSTVDMFSFTNEFFEFGLDVTNFALLSSICFCLQTPRWGTARRGLLFRNNNNSDISHCSFALVSLSLILVMALINGLRMIEFMHDCAM